MTKTWNYTRTNEDQEFSQSEEIRRQLKRMDTNDPKREDTLEEYMDAVLNEDKI